MDIHLENFFRSVKNICLYNILVHTPWTYLQSVHTLCLELSLKGLESLEDVEEQKEDIYDLKQVQFEEMQKYQERQVNVKQDVGSQNIDIVYSK